jgi:hypothetical protein
LVGFQGIKFSSLDKSRWHRGIALLSKSFEYGDQ